MRATSPALAEAAARSEMQRLQRELAAAQAQPVKPADEAAPQPVRNAGIITPRFAVCGILISLLCGFWLGYVILARRVKRKFGGIRIY